jgi:retron-type reverse transcriptase
MADNVKVHVITTNGGRKQRTIYAPSKVLSWVQTRIREGLLMQIQQPEYVTGFVPGRGIAYNARIHVNSRTVVNIDLKDFFPSITPKRVYGLLSTVFRLPSAPASTLTKIMTFDGHLCQGFVTSPDIANLVSWRLDRRVSALASKLGLRYSRYADDLTFSGSDWHGSVDKFIDIVRTIVSEEGFTVNDKKIAIMRRGRRQTVTGAVVSDNGIGLRASKRKILRAACHHWQQQSEDRRRQIRGWISYVSSLNPAHAAELEAMIAKSEGQWSKNVNNSADFSADIGRK